MTTSILTQHIKNYDTKLPQQVLDALAKLLRSELHKRGLWIGEPYWLGIEYSEWDTWKNPKAFNDLLYHCYMYAIVARKQSLHNALKKSENIDHLIYLNIKHFLDDSNKKNNPLSYAVASNVKTTIEKAIKAQILVNQSGKLNTKTLLSFSNITPHHQVACNYKQLQQSFYSIKGWQQICIKLVQNTPTAQNLFYQFICNLGKNSNITCFCYDDLMKIMKAETSQLYNLSYSLDKDTAKNELNDDDEIILFTNPDTSFEDWENWMHSIKQIRQNIDEQSWQQRVKKGAIDVFDKLVELVEADEPIPSQAELANSLNIQSPQTVNNYLKRLQEIGALKILPEKNG